MVVLLNLDPLQHGRDFVSPTGSDFFIFFRSPCVENWQGMIRILGTEILCPPLISNQSHFLHAHYNIGLKLKGTSTIT